MSDSLSPAFHHPAAEAAIAALSGLFGDRVVLSQSVREHHGHGESFHATQMPDAVVFVESTAEVAQVVRLCVHHRIPMVPFGAGSSMEGQVQAVEGGICVDLSRMDKVLAVRAEDMDCTVQPGVTRQTLNTFLRDRGLFFPIDPGAEATLGGMASTRASGTNAVRYGTMKDVVLAMEVVLADGRIIRTGSRARKSSAGYDLTRLLIGAEGTLGFITELTLRLFPIPEKIAAAVCAFPDLESAVSCVVATQQCGVTMSRIEFADTAQVAAINAYCKTTFPECPVLFLEFAGSPEAVDAEIAIVQSLAEDFGGGGFDWAETEEARRALWHARHMAAYAALQVRPGCKGLPTDVCVPISRLVECIAETHKELEASPLPAPIVGHVGDGNFHLMIVFNPDDPAELAEAERLDRTLGERALAMGGTCTGEHGIGLGKTGLLALEVGEALAVMRTIKGALDPLGLMNPGKLFPKDPVS
ncbi:MAG: FAD-binding protein [Rhodospirillum sp.]|nr:FAD-binding protein [Rhodospirillum sp.]MCF8491845.1 FAD-binding protein [Rhodospirillum sp.]MCF8502466.1 FAD-binding protein [Rhodospirillum sp.]